MSTTRRISSRNTYKPCTTPRSAGIRIPETPPIHKSEFTNDFYNGTNEHGDLAPGSSDPDRYPSGVYEDIYFMRVKNGGNSKTGKKLGNTKKNVQAVVGPKRALKAQAMANNRTEKQRRHVRREYDIPVCSPGTSVENPVVLSEFSETYLSFEAKQIELQINGRQSVDLIDLTSLHLTTVNYHFAHMSNKTSITKVDLSHNSLAKLPECFQLDNVHRFHAEYNKIKSVNITTSMRSLVELNLNSNEIVDFPSREVLRCMPSISNLVLSMNKIKNLPVDSMLYLAEIQLKDLNLSFNELTEIPNELCAISTLRSLRLGNNFIRRLPRTIVSLNLLGPNAFDVTGNQLVYPPQDIAKLGMNNIKSYFSLERDNRARFNQFKLIVVGHESAGKTSIISCLNEQNMDYLSSSSGKSGISSPFCTREFSSDDLSSVPPLIPSISYLGRTRSDVSSISDATATARGGRTVGLEISTLNLKIPNQAGNVMSSATDDEMRIDTTNTGDDVVQLSIWDFAGQEVYHSAHEVFFSAQALYLIVWNMSEHSRVQIETKVQFWIDLVQARAPGSKIIIVATRADQCRDTKDDIINMLMEQLSNNETLRLHDIQAEILKLQNQLELLVYRSSGYRQLKLKMALLKKSLNMRPHIVTCAPVISETDVDGLVKPGYNIDSLLSAIRLVSTATSDEMNPFQLVNVFLPRYYAHVRQAAESLRRSRTIITMDALHKASMIEAETQSASPCTITIKETESAVAFLSCIGEIVWFREGSLCPLNEDSDGEFDEEEQFYENFDVNALFDNTSTADANTDDSATWSWVDSVDIGSYVVLNPHWLLNAVKGVLTHELLTDVRMLRQSLGIAESDRTYGMSIDERNGIINWPIIEKLLSRRSEIALEPEERQSTLKVLRILLERFNIIVPIRMDASIPSSSGTHPGQRLSQQDGTSGSPITSAKTGIGSILTVGVPEVHKSSSNPDLHAPAGLSSLCPRANSASVLSGHSSSCQSPTKPVDAGTRFGSPLASHASVNALSSLSDRGVSAPALTASRDRLYGYKRNRSVGDNLFSAIQPDVADEYFLVPALLNDIDCPTVPKFARPGHIRMERKFRLQRFVPPGLIPRIIACSYQYVKEKPMASRHPGALNQCWKSAFSQKHGNVHIWLWLDDRTNSDYNLREGDRATIRIVGFGNFSGAKGIVEWLDKYCTAVAHVLKEFPGLCHLSQSIICPTCIMSQHDEGDCGEFSCEELYNILDESYFENSHTGKNDCCSDETRFEHKQAMCARRQCMIPFELLVVNPHQNPDSKNSSQHQMERRIEYLMNEIVRLSSVPSSSCEKSVASVAVAYIPTTDMQHIKSWVASGIDNSADLSLVANPVSNAYLKTLGTGAFTRIAESKRGSAFTIVLSCAHFCINEDTKSFPIEEIPGYDAIFLVGDTGNWLYIAELITLGTEFASRDIGDILINLDARPTLFNCSACMTENSVSNRYCSRCKLRKPGEGFWDVSALALTYSIMPTQRLSMDNCVRIEPVGFANFTNLKAYDVCSEMPTREQSLRLLGLSGLSSLSSDFGRVVQIIHGLLLVNVYNENGASGGPVLDRLGRLVGVLSCANPDEAGIAYIEPIQKFVKLLQMHTFTENRHDPAKCNFCELHPLVKEKFCH